MAPNDSARRKGRGQSTAQRVESGPRTTLVNATITQFKGYGGQNGAGGEGAPHGGKVVSQVGPYPGAPVGLPEGAGSAAPEGGQGGWPAQGAQSGRSPQGVQSSSPQPGANQAGWPAQGANQAAQVGWPAQGGNQAAQVGWPAQGANQVAQTGWPSQGANQAVQSGWPLQATGQGAPAGLAQTAAPGMASASPPVGLNQARPAGWPPGAMPPGQPGGLPGISMAALQAGLGPFGWTQPGSSVVNQGGWPLQGAGAAGQGGWPQPGAGSGFDTLAVQPGPSQEPQGSVATTTAAPAANGPAVSITTTGDPPSERPAFVPPPPAPAAQQFRFLMTSQGLPGLAKLGAAPTGEVLLTGRPGEGYAIAGRIYGMPALADRSLSPTLWLLHDLMVPLDLTPADLAVLPRGNQLGLHFTQDGRPPSFGPQANVITIAVPVGVFELSPEGTWQANALLTPTVNQTFHPLSFLGPNDLADPNQAMPSGTMTGILTDLFLRQATLLPHLRVRENHAERLRAICQIWATKPAQYLDGAAFTRVAVTLEGPVRSTPSRLPTQEALILWGNNRAQLA